MRSGGRRPAGRAGLPRQFQRAARRIRDSIVASRVRAPASAVADRTAAARRPPPVAEPPPAATPAEQAELDALREDLAAELARLARGGGGRR